MAANVSSDHLGDVPEGFIAGFNAPEFRAGGSFSNIGFGKQNRFGFNVSYRWQDKIDYQGDFANGVVPAYQVVDAQLSYKFFHPKFLLKIGATNLLNEYYRNGFGNPAIGGLYYVSLGYNVF